MSAVRYHDQDSQDDQEDQECPPSTRMFLIALFATYTHVSYIFKTSVQIQLNGGDARYHDRHKDSQDDQEDQECPPTTRMFLMALFAPDTHV